VAARSKVRSCLGLPNAPQGKSSRAPDGHPKLSQEPTLHNRAAAYRNSNARHQTGSVRNAATALTPTISEISRASRPYWMATIEPPIYGGIAAPNKVTSVVRPRRLINPA
jgi:hypothetical protein